MNDPSRRDVLKLGVAGAAAALGLGSQADAAEPTVGMIFPPANYPVPPEAHRLYPSGVRFLSRGVGLERMTPEGYDKVLDRVIPSAMDLAHAGSNAISLMGTSLSFYKGAAFNQQLSDAISKATGLRATTMSTSVVDALNAVGARRIAVATAYADEVNRRLRIFLTESGFDVLTLKGLGIERFADAPPVTQDGLFTFSANTYAAAPKADALFISCGNLKTIDLVVPLEQRCKVPVISSTPHALWGAVRLVGLSGRSPGFGRLLERG
jgi:arylmalonate decarboxylase